jgi:predicted dehydrogenase
LSIRFAAIGITHDHINGMTEMLLEAGATLVSFFADEDDLAAGYIERFPQARRVADRRAILEDASIQLILTSAVPADRATISIAAMQAGKDVLSDKPGMTSLGQLDEVRRVQQQTGRIFSVLYSEHFERRSVVKAGELVAAGAIGKVINMVGLGPHRLRPRSRKPYFFERRRYGGILTDIGSHQLEQFLFFTGATEVEVVAATVANRAHPQWPGLQDFGELSLRASDATGFVRVDWFTPDGLATWGDGRLFILGTEGYIELRKYIDIAGRPGAEHLFLVDGKGTQYIDCNGVERPFGRQLIADVLNRSETAMPQARCYKAMELAITAQALAERGTEWQQ